MNDNRNVVEETLDLINNLFRSKLSGDLNAMEFTMSRKEVADILNHVKMSIANNCVAIPDGLHPDTRELVLDFAGKMAKKLHKAQIKYGFDNGWRHPNWDTAKGNDQFSDPTQCLIAFSHHIDKGDPVDVANYCAFMDWHGWSSKYLGTDNLVKVGKVVADVYGSERFLKVEPECTTNLTIGKDYLYRLKSQFDTDHSSDKSSKDTEITISELKVASEPGYGTDYVGSRGEMPQ